MLILYVVLLFGAIILSIRETKTMSCVGVCNDKRPFWVKHSLFVFFVALLFLSTFRPSTLPDYEQYVRIFTEDDMNDVRYELGNVIVIRFLRLFTNNVRVYFFFFGAAGIGMKLYAIYKYSPCVFLSIAIYLAGFFVLLDMIQVRNSIAISFYLYAVIYKCKGNWKKTFLFTILAFCFHYSAISVFLLALLSCSKRIKYYAWLIPFSYFLVLSGRTIGFLLGGMTGGALESVFLSNSTEGDINIFNSVIIVRILFVYIILLYFKQLYLKYSYVGIMVKIYIISIAAYVLLSDVPTVAARVGHFLAAVEIILLPLLIFIGDKYRILYQYLIYAYCFGSLIIFLYSEDNML